MQASMESARNASKKKKNSLDKNKITCYYKTVIITIINLKETKNKNKFFIRKGDHNYGKMGM